MPTKTKSRYHATLHPKVDESAASSSSRQRQRRDGPARRRTVAALREFLTGAPAEPESDRVLATVLFTDIVDSTVRAAGDRRWREVLDRHDRAGVDRRHFVYAYPISPIHPYLRLTYPRHTFVKQAWLFTVPDGG